MSDRSVIIPESMRVQYDEWHLAPAVRVGDSLYCSGQLGLAADGSLPESAEAQFVNAFEAVKTVLEAAGASFANVVEMSSFHVGLVSEMQVFTKVRDRYLEEPYPAQTAVGVAELGVPGAIVELKVTAVL
jgi:enamine deaminase RidA (YjgF/YER057c/UK114 family)